MVRVATLVLAAAASSAAWTVSSPFATAQRESWRAAARVLLHSDSFRARTQAALALGTAEDDGAFRPLARALREDPHPSVRAAAAHALGALGALEGVPALRDAQTDPSTAVQRQVRRSLRLVARHQAAAAAAVRRERQARRRAAAAAPALEGESRAAGAAATAEADEDVDVDVDVDVDEGAALAAATGPGRWDRVERVVVLGTIDNRTEVQLPGAENRVRGAMTRRLARVPGTLVFPSRASVSSGARAVMERKRLPRLRVEAHWVEAERTQAGDEASVRCAVELLLLAEPAEILRGTLEGAVTARAPGRVDDPRHTSRLTERALVGAVRAALADAGTVLERAGAEGR